MKMALITGGLPEHEAVKRHLAGQMSVKGYAVIFSPVEEPGLVACYTVGLWPKHYEVMVYGPFEFAEAVGMVNTVAENLHKGTWEPLAPGHERAIGEESKAATLRVHELGSVASRTAVCAWAQWFHGTPMFGLHHLVVRDQQGHYPEHTDADPLLRKQSGIWELEVERTVN